MAVIAAGLGYPSVTLAGAITSALGLAMLLLPARRPRAADHKGPLAGETA